MRDELRAIYISMPVCHVNCPAVSREEAIGSGLKTRKPREIWFSDLLEGHTVILLPHPDHLSLMRLGAGILDD